jgi:hypothetical protein
MICRPGSASDYGIRIAIKLLSFRSIAKASWDFGNKCHNLEITMGTFHIQERRREYIGDKQYQ